MHIYEHALMHNFLITISTTLLLMCQNNAWVNYENLKFHAHWELISIIYDVTVHITYKFTLVCLFMR